MKSHLQRRREADMRRMEKFAGRDMSKEMLNWERNTKDPTVQIRPVSQQYPIMGMRIKIVQAALRYIQGLGVPAKRAHELARACGHDGELAYRIEDYEAILKEKYGKRTNALTDREFMNHMQKTNHGKLTIAGSLHGLDKQMEERVLMLRAAIKAFEMFDVPPQEVERGVGLFGKAGKQAFAIEDYGARMLTRRERVRH